MDIRGDVPRPRVWFEDVPATIKPFLERRSGGHEEWGSSEQEIHEADFDLVVTFGSEATRRRSTRLHCLAFGAESAVVRREHKRAASGTSGPVISPSVPAVRVPSPAWLYLQGETHSRSVSIPTELTGVPNTWKKLLERTVAEQLPKGEKRFWHMGNFITEPDPLWTPLVIAGQDRPSGPASVLTIRSSAPNSGHLLLLPEETIDHAAWLTTFIKYLRDLDPAAFPTDPDWRSRPEWAPQGLADALQARADIEIERQRTLSSLDERAATADALIERELSSSEIGSTRLLTAQGDGLVDAVIAALGELGFEVRNMDEEREEGDPKLEDLRVRDPAVPGWELLAEVKGYTKGAKANDVRQVLLRPMQAYVKEFSRLPAGYWHIVNTWIEADPSTREVALNNDPALDFLAESEGALIDTRDLFKGLQAVNSGAVSAETIRKSMREARLRWVIGSRQSVNSSESDV